ncbi:hypothetical protein BJV74DRAFT_587329 [Russula compacta]|nr:hypothetical protein BJV74DRAFT_587329 [Russula compacta]
MVRTRGRRLWIKLAGSPQIPGARSIGKSACQHDAEKSSSRPSSTEDSHTILSVPIIRRFRSSVDTSFATSPPRHHPPRHPSSPLLLDIVPRLHSPSLNSLLAHSRSRRSPPSLRLPLCSNHRLPLCFCLHRLTSSLCRLPSAFFLRLLT